MSERWIRWRAAARRTWRRLRGAQSLPAVEVVMDRAVRGWVLRLAATVLVLAGLAGVGAAMVGSGTVAQAGFIAAVVTVPGAAMAWQALAAVRLGMRVEMRVVGRFCVRWAVCSAVGLGATWVGTRAEAGRGTLPWAGLLAAAGLLAVAYVFARVVRTSREDS